MPALRQIARFPAAWALLAAAAAALPAASARPAAAQEDPSPLAAGRRALERGALDEAYAHYLAHRASGADPRAAIEALWELAERAGDEDAREAWAYEWAHAVTPSDGRPPRPPKSVRSDPGKALALAKLRAAAVADLIAAAAKRERLGARQPHERAVAAWLRRLALELALPMDEVLAGVEAGLATETLAPDVLAPPDAHVAVLEALSLVMESALSNLRFGEAVRAARIVHALGVQAEFEDLDGPRPSGMARWRSAGAETLRRARERMQESAPEPWTVERLEWLDSAEGEAFSREHSSFASPGVAVSPRGWYRIESDCGYETLLGVAKTVEQHHERLAGFFGSDPFVERRADGTERVLRQGLVRIVPTADGLESEGAPYFWVGGFQSGDLTVLRFSVGDIEGLGRGLTHELTHRFDGALHPGIPPWLAEGRAVWTGAAYGAARDDEFIAAFAPFGTFTEVLNRGYGGAGKLGALVSGEPDDYRENYSAGCALYVYLKTWPPAEEPLYAERLAAFEAAGAARDAAGEKARFVAAFCDGADGRPKDLEELAERFGEFCAGFYWREPAPWRVHYTEDVPVRGGAAWVLDDATWVWSWQRAEPAFGQDQARLAGELLLELGRREPAAAAFAFARSCDGFVPATHDAWLAALEGVKRSADAAWVLESELRFPGAPAAGPPPFTRDLDSTRRWLAAARESALAARAGTRTRAILSSEHDRVARWIGAPELGPVSDIGGAMHPLERAPVRLSGWATARLAGADDDSPLDAWAELPDGTLLVGRRSDRTGTGRIDRGGGEPAFALSALWSLPGTYLVRTRIAFTTGFNEVDLVVGHTRRDRNVRLRLTAGDFMYSIGEDDAPPAFDEVAWRFDGRRDREAGLDGALRRGMHRMERSKTVVDVELLVDGASVTAYLDGALAGTYHTVDGAPIEGRVGVAAHRGAVRVEAPTVQRLERGLLAGSRARPARALDLARSSSPSFDELENLPVRGLALSRAGRLLLWIPAYEPGEDLERAGAKLARAVERLAERGTSLDVVQPLAVALPSGLGAEAIASHAARFGALTPAVEVATHHVPAGDEAPDRGRLWLLFLDAANVVRVALPWVDGAAMYDGRLAHWLAVFRRGGR